MIERDIDFTAIVRDLQAAPNVPLEWTPAALFMCCAELQLALRHPLNDGPAVLWAETFIREAKRYLPASAVAVIEAGFDATAQTPAQRIADELMGRVAGPLVCGRRVTIENREEA